MEFNHFFSFGNSCYPGTIADIGGFRKFSGPFDWNAGSLAITEDCLDTDFSDFLDKSQYVPVVCHEPRCGHKKYGETYFIHKDPSRQDHYDYYCRTVERFRLALKSSTSKLFMFTTFPILPGHLMSVHTCWRPEFDWSTIERIIQKVSEKSAGSSYFLVWNINLGKPRNLAWYQHGSIIIANVDTPHNDYYHYHFDNTEYQITLDAIKSHFNFVDKSSEFLLPSD
jgi:hypothetical protein